MEYVYAALTLNESDEEINEEIKEAFEEAGGEEFTYIPCLNAEPDHVAMIEAIVLNELKGWIEP